MKPKAKNNYFYIFVFLFSIVVFFGNGRFGGDGLENYLVAESIVLNGNTIIHHKPFGVKEMRHPEREKGPIGMALVLVPLYFLGNMVSKVIPAVSHDYITQFFVSFANPLIIALTALILFLFLRHLNFTLPTCSLTMFSYFFATMTIIYSRSGFTEPLIGLLILLIFICIYKFEKFGSVKFILYAVFFLGYALLSKINSFLYLPLSLVYIIYQVTFSKLSRKFKYISLIITLSLCVFFAFYFLKVRLVNFDVILKSAIAERFQIIKGAAYYLLSTGKGYFIYNLPLLLALFGIKSFFIRKRRFAVYIIIFIMANFIFYSYRFNRGSLFSWGPRYLYPTVPLFCLFLAEYIERLKTSGAKAVFYGTLLIGFLIQLPCLFINFSDYLFFVKDGLGLEEYLINFIPELSPICGSWYLFISALTKTVTGTSLNFVFQPDPLFMQPVIKSLAGYDRLDLWWLNAVTIYPKLSLAINIVIFLLVSIVLICYLKIRKIIVQPTKPI